MCNSQFLCARPAVRRGCRAHAKICSGYPVSGGDKLSPTAAEKVYGTPLELVVILIDMSESPVKTAEQNHGHTC